MDEPSQRKPEDQGYVKSFSTGCRKLKPHRDSQDVDPYNRYDVNQMGQRNAVSHSIREEDEDRDKYHDKYSLNRPPYQGEYAADQSR